MKPAAQPLSDIPSDTMPQRITLRLNRYSWRCGRCNVEYVCRIGHVFREDASCVVCGFKWLFVNVEDLLSEDAGTSPQHVAKIKLVK